MKLSRGAWAALTLLTALLLAHSWYGPDIWYHLTWGRDIWTLGTFQPEPRVLLRQPLFPNIYWLFQLVVFALFDYGGLWIASAFFAVAWFFVLSSIARLSRAFSAGGIGLAWMIAVVGVAQLRFEQRPEVLSYVWLSALLLILSRGIRGESLRRRDFGVAFVVQVLWTNCHGYFALGPLVAAALLVASVFGGAGTWRPRPALSLLALLVLGSFVSPFGWTTWETIVSLAPLSRQLSDVNAEFFPIWKLEPSVPLALFAVLAIVTLVSVFRPEGFRRELAGRLWALGGVVLGISAVRNGPLFLILSAPLVGQVLPGWQTKIERLVSHKAQIIVGGFALAVLLGLGARVVTGDFHRDVGSLGSFGVKIERASYPIGAVDYLRDLQFHGRLYLDSYDGGYAEYFLPQAFVLGDSYFSDEAVTREFFRAIQDPRAVFEMDQRFRFDAALVNIENLAVMAAFWNNKDWRLAFVDSHRALFRRATPDSALAIDWRLAQFAVDGDIRNSFNEFGPRQWLEFANGVREPALTQKVLGDLAAAGQLSSFLLWRSLSAALAQKDQGLIEFCLALIPKVRDPKAADWDQIQAKIQRGEPLPGH